ncbi:MAG TPA: hypothetical protein PKC43_12920 [Phycisphaerales bacterium]|nr:hypothetical protein [Phycisphaerales bacterium]HMP38336.1 hypothetical protein [Phycisphaerales bacterium]
MLLYATDLIFTTRISAEARAQGARLEIARGLTSMEGRLADSPELVIVDLDADDAVAAISAAAATSPRPRIVAFVAHVRADLAAEARSAGADEVLARSAFVARLPGLVASLGQPPA